MKLISPIPEFSRANRILFKIMNKNGRVNYLGVLIDSFKEKLPKNIRIVVLSLNSRAISLVSSIKLLPLVIPGFVCLTTTYVYRLSSKMLVEQIFDC